MYIFLLVLGGGGGGQDKPAWTACPPGVKLTRVGERYPGTACPPGASCPGGKINWDTTILMKYVLLYFFYSLGVYLCCKPETICNKLESVKVLLLSERIISS